MQIDPAKWSEYHDEVYLRAPSGVRIETPRLRDEGAHTVYWRVRMDQPTTEPLVFDVGYYMAEKSLVATDGGRGLRTANPRRAGSGFFDRLLFPAEPGFDANWPVRGVDVHYPSRSTPIFGLDIPWWLTFFIVAMVAALAARPFLRVQF